MSYRDRWISCDATTIRIRGYYFPWGTKSVPFERLRAVRRVQMSALRGRGRIWGTANVRYWASLDPRRPSKTTAFVLDVGASVSPFVTPDDPDAFLADVLAHSSVDHVDDATGPLV